MQVFDGPGGCVIGPVNPAGELSGTELAYVYPDGSNALVVYFASGKLVAAQPAMLLESWQHNQSSLVQALV